MTRIPTCTRKVGVGDALGSSLALRAGICQPLSLRSAYLDLGGYQRDETNHASLWTAPCSAEAGVKVKNRQAHHRPEVAAVGRRLLVGLRGLEPRIVLRMREEPGLGAKVKRCVGCWKVLWGHTRVEKLWKREELHQSWESLGGKLLDRVKLGGQQ